MTLKINPNELASIEIHQGLNAKIQSYAWERYGKSLVYDPVAKDSEDWVTFETLINDLLSRANAGLEKKIDRKNSSLYRLLDGINPGGSCTHRDHDNLRAHDIKEGCGKRKGRS